MEYGFRKGEVDVRFEFWRHQAARGQNEIKLRARQKKLEDFTTWKLKGGLKYNIIYMRASSKRLNFELNMCILRCCIVHAYFIIISVASKRLSFVVITVQYYYLCIIVKSSCISLLSGRPCSLPSLP